jgi:restriction endonuclease S subunit
MDEILPTYRTALSLSPVQIQRVIADKLDAEFAKTRALQQTIAAKFANVEKLPTALLRAAFSPAGKVD